MALTEVQSNLRNPEFLLPGWANKSDFNKSNGVCYYTVASSPIPHCSSQHFTQKTGGNYRPVSNLPLGGKVIEQSVVRQVHRIICDTCREQNHPCRGSFRWWWQCNVSTVRTECQMASPAVETVERSAWRKSLDFFKDGYKWNCYLPIFFPCFLGPPSFLSTTPPHWSPPPIKHRRAQAYLG